MLNRRIGNSGREPCIASGAPLRAQVLLLVAGGADLVSPPTGTCDQRVVARARAPYHSQHVADADPDLVGRHAYIAVPANPLLDAPVAARRERLGAPLLPKVFDLDELLAAIKQAAARLPA